VHEVGSLRKEEHNEKRASTRQPEQTTADSPEIFCPARMESGSAAGGKEAGGFVLHLNSVGSYSQPEE